MTGRTVAAHLVLDAAHTHAVEIAHDAVVIHLSLRHEEERDALRPFGRTRQPREDAVHDVARQIVLAYSRADDA